MKSSGSSVNADILAQLGEYQSLQQELNEVSDQINGYEVQQSTAISTANLTKQKVSEEVETIRLENIRDTSHDLQFSDGGREKGMVFHIKILNTVISANRAPNEIDNVASGPDASNAGALDGKSADSLPIRKAQSSIFRVTSGLTIKELLQSAALFWWIDKGSYDNLSLTSEAGFVWPLTTQVQDVLEGKNTSVSRVACVLHLMEKTHSGSEAGIHAAPVATVLPLTEAIVNTEEPEIADEDILAVIYEDLKRGHIYAQHKDRVPSANTYYWYELLISAPVLFCMGYLTAIIFLVVTNTDTTAMTSQSAYFFEKGLKRRLLTPYFTGTRKNIKWEAFDTINTLEGIEDFFLRGLVPGDASDQLRPGSGVSSCSASSSLVASAASTAVNQEDLDFVRLAVSEGRPDPELYKITGGKCTVRVQEGCEINNKMPCDPGSGNNKCGPCIEGFQYDKDLRECIELFCTSTNWVNNQTKYKFKADCSLALRHGEQCRLYNTLTGFKAGSVKCDATTNSYIATAATAIVCQEPPRLHLAYEVVETKSREFLDFEMTVGCKPGAVQQGKEPEVSRCDASDAVFRVSGCRESKPASPFQKILFPATASTPQGQGDPLFGYSEQKYNYISPEWYVTDERATGSQCNLNRRQLASNQIIGPVRFWKKVDHDKVENKKIFNCPASYTYYNYKTTFKKSPRAIPAGLFGNDGMRYNNEGLYYDFIFSIDIMERTLLTLFRNQGDALSGTSPTFIDDCTLAAGVSMVFFNTNYRRFSTVTLLIETPPSGQIKTNVNIETTAIFGAFDKIDFFVLPCVCFLSLTCVLLMDAFKYYRHLNFLMGSTKDSEHLIQSLKKYQGPTGYLKLLWRVHRYVLRHVCFEHNCAVLDMLLFLSLLAAIVVSMRLNEVVHLTEAIQEQRTGTHFLDFKNLTASGISVYDYERSFALFVTISMALSIFRIFVLIWRIAQPLSPKFKLLLRTFICSCIHVTGTIFLLMFALLIFSLMVHWLLSARNMADMRYKSIAFYRVVMQCIGLASFETDVTHSNFQERVQFIVLLCIVAMTRIVAVMLATVYFARTWQLLRTKEFQEKSIFKIRVKIGKPKPKKKKLYHGDLRDDLVMPQVGLALTKRNNVRETVLAALSGGCMRISLPSIHSPLLPVVGEALKDFFTANPEILRKHIWITGSFVPEGDKHGYQQAFDACTALLAGTQLTYLDLLVVERGNKTTDRIDVWRGMETLLSMGTVRSVGVGGYHLGLIEELLHNCEVKPDVAQFKLNPLDSRPLVIKRLREWGIHIEHNDGADKKWVTQDGYKSVALNKAGVMANKLGLTKLQLFHQWHLQSGFAITCPQDGLAHCLKHQEVEILDREEMRTLNFGLW